MKLLFPIVLAYLASCLIGTGAEPSTTTDVLERRMNELEAQLTELALADNVVGASFRGLKTGKGKGSKGKSCYDSDGELDLKWLGEYGNLYNKGFVVVNQTNGEPIGIPFYPIGPVLVAQSVSIGPGPPGTNSYETTYGNPLDPAHKPIMQQFDGLLTG